MIDSDLNYDKVCKEWATTYNKKFHNVKHDVLYYIWQNMWSSIQRQVYTETKFVIRSSMRSRSW
jgi:hypothetical protein